MPAENDTERNPPTLHAEWFRDGRFAWLHEDDHLLGSVRLVDDWHQPGSFVATAAWVVDWMEPGLDPMQRSLVELDGQPATDTDRMAELSAKALETLKQGPPAAPAGFGFASGGLGTPSEIRDLIELTSHGLGMAEERLTSAARITEDYAAVSMGIALTETLAWVRALDDLMRRVWRDHISRDTREEISKAVDQYLRRPGVVEGLLAEEQAERRKTGEPYPDWTVSLVSRGSYLPRRELQGFRWLAGKLLHHGPLAAIELQHWRAGEQPRWKWRPAEAIFPSKLQEERPAQRETYDKHLAGRDVLGTLNLGMVLIETEHLFFRLLRETEEGHGAA